MRRQSLLLSEVHHRVKNNLQLIIGLLDLHGKYSGEKGNGSLLVEVSNKVRSISLIHEQLYGEGDFDKIDIEDYLTSLVQNFRELPSETDEPDFLFDIEKLELSIDTVLPIGIICAELMSNSVKYAAKPNAKLKISIKLETNDDMQIFTYQDNGPGYTILEGDKANGHNEKSIGLYIISSMVRQLKADQFIYNDLGAVFRMTFLEKRTSRL